MWFDGDDDNDSDKQQAPKPEQGDYNMGDDIGERIGEGHDSVEDNVT